MSTRNPNELVDRYLQAVRFWLPKAQKEDLVAELGEDLRSQIEDKEAELGRALNEEEISAILKRCGVPIAVAGRIGPQRQLIGPTLFPIYEFVLKMVLFWIIVPVFLFILIPVNVANAGANWASGVAATFGQLCSGLFIAAGIITLVFAIIERSPVVTSATSKWDPRQLPPVHKMERKPASRLQAACHLFFAVFGFTWLLLIPQHPWMILGPAAAFLEAAPMWHIFYGMIVLLALVSIVRPIVALAKPQWTWFPPVAELMQAVFTLIVLKFILKGGFPYLVLTHAASATAQQIHVAAIVNVSILVSLAGAWLGLGIALVIQTWQVLKQVRRRFSGAGPTASLQTQ